MVRACRLAVAFMVCAVAPITYSQAPLCNSQYTYAKLWFGNDPACFGGGSGPSDVGCQLRQDYYCGNQQARSAPMCNGYWESGVCATPKLDYCKGAFCPLAPPEVPCSACVSRDTYDSCAIRGSPTDLCAADGHGNGVDDDNDGCIDEGCTIGSGACSCPGFCDSPRCSPPDVATCDPFNGAAELCGDGRDNNCNGRVDEGCATCKSPHAGGSGDACECAGQAGDDPLLLATQSAVTEPFTDFSAEAIVRLGITRTYSSADASLVGGEIGIFGPGWHHDWEATLTCSGEYCTVSRGLVSGLSFRRTGTALSLDGSEEWEIYGRGDTATNQIENPNVLVRRPSGEWITYLVDGRELHFETVCDACGTQDAYCTDPTLGGKARLVEVRDAVGNRFFLSYDRPTGLLLGLSDELGHSLELRNANACTEGVVRRLDYDATTVARYDYTAAGDLEFATDADGNVLRSFSYEPGERRLLLAVSNEASAAIAEFTYDVQGRAESVLDARSNVSVAYSSGGVVDVKEYYSTTFASSRRVIDRDGHVASVSDGCACGPARTVTHVDRSTTCDVDSLGHVGYTARDEVGRVIRVARYDDTYSCPPPTSLTSLPSKYEEQWRDYGLRRSIAEGVAIDLDMVTTTSRNSTYGGAKMTSESFDRDQAYNAAIDPAGYQCVATPLPAGSVVCRSIVSGYTTDAVTRTVVNERQATFFSYDARGRLVKKVGPVNLDRASVNDVPPVEARTYWPDSESLVRRGRLHEVKRYPSPTSTTPLVTSFDYDLFGLYQVTDPRGAMRTFVKDGRGRTRYVITADAETELRYYDGTSVRLRISPSGSVERTSYDTKGRISKIERLDRDPDPVGATPNVGWSEHHQYDQAGNPKIVERRDASGTISWKRVREYDVQHRVVRDTHPQSSEAARSWNYDASGFLTSVVDEDGRTTEFVPDELNRVAAVRKKGVGATGAQVQLDIAAYAYEPYQSTLDTVSDGKTEKADYRNRPGMVVLT